MKQRLFVLIPLLFLLLFWGCQSEEDFAEKGNYQSDFTVKKIDLNEFKKVAPLAFEKTESLVKSAKTEFGKNGLVTEEFIIDTSQILQIIKGNQISYTIPIDMGNDDGAVENLVLSLQADNSYAVKRVSYNLTVAEKELVSKGDFVNLSNKYSISEWGNIASTSAKGSTCYDVEYEYEMCCNNIHSTLDIMNGVHCTCPQPPTEYTVVISSYACGGGDGGFGTPGEIGQNPTTGPGTGPISGGGGGGTTPTHPITNPTNPTGPAQPSDGIGGVVITKPIIFVPVGTDANCNDLKLKSKDPDFKAKMTELKNDANNTVESAYVTYTSPKYSPKQVGGIDTQGSYLDIEYNTAANPNHDVTGYMHCHLNVAAVENLAVFSLEDLITFGKMVSSSTVNTPSVFTIFVTSAKGTFALKISNKQSFINAMNKLEMGRVYYEKNYAQKIKSGQNASVQASAFLKFLKENKLEGAQLYSSDSNFENWQEITLDQNLAIVYTGC